MVVVTTGHPQIVRTPEPVAESIETITDDSGYDRFEITATASVHKLDMRLLNTIFWTLSRLRYLRQQLGFRRRHIYINCDRDRDRTVERSAITVNLDQIFCLRLAHAGKLKTHRYALETGEISLWTYPFDLYIHMRDWDSLALGVTLD